MVTCVTVSFAGFTALSLGVLAGIYFSNKNSEKLSEAANTILLEINSLESDQEYVKQLRIGLIFENDTVKLDKKS